MKKIISFLGLFIALVLHVHASPVSVSKALQVAQRFFATTSPSTQGELKVQFTAKGTPTEPNKNTEKHKLELTLRVLKQRLLMHSITLLIVEKATDMLLFRVMIEFNPYLLMPIKAV